MIQKLAIAVVAVATISTSACSIYRLDTRQGNAIDVEDVAKVELGMTRADVRNILGSPSVSDPFHSDRADYVYYFNKEGRSEPERARVTVFYQDGVVTKIDTLLAE